jgi:hypothetical protein
MEATPREQEVGPAVATNDTGDPIVAPFVGLVTATLAKADVAKTAIKHTYTQGLFNAAPLQLIGFCRFENRTLDELLLTQILLSPNTWGKQKNTVC